MKMRREFLVFISFCGMGSAFILVDIAYGIIRHGDQWSMYFLGIPQRGAIFLRIMVLLVSIIVGLLLALYHYNVLRTSEITALDKHTRHISYQRRRVETFLDLIMERSFDGIALCEKDEGGAIKAIMFNDRYAEMAGLPREKLTQANDIRELRTHIDLEHDDLERIAHGMSRCGVLEWKRPDKSENYIEWTSTPVPLDGGECFIEIARDITDRRRMEQQFYHAQKMETVWRLAGGLAHDFNNQLTVIKGYCDLLKMQGLADGEVGECIVEIQKATESAGELTGKMLAYSRTRSERSEIVDVADIARRVGATMERVCGEDHLLHVKCDNKVGTVKVDSVLFEQAIVNLVSNAADAMPGAGTITLAAYNMSLGADFVGSHLGGRMGPHCVIEVSDSGEGIDEDVLDQIFEPFFTTKDRGKGTGLGLAMVYSFVRQSSGHIDVESKPDCGSTFKLFLPRMLSKVAESVAEQTDIFEPMPSGHETVLVAEDEEGLLKYMSEVLRRCGYKVLEGGLPDSALQLAEDYSEQIDLLLTDVVMPGMMGPELADRVRVINGDLRVLFVSGYPDRLDSEHKSSGNYLAKPFDPAQLARAVRAAIDGTGNGDCG